MIRPERRFSDAGLDRAERTTNDERRTDDDDTFSGDTPCNMETIDIDRRCVPRNQCMSSARIGRLLHALCGEQLRVLLISLKMSDNWVWYHSVTIEEV